MQHPYCYPGTTVYRNKENIRDAHDLERFERFVSAIRLEELPPGIPFTPAGYRAIHWHMLQDVYDWAGQDRMVETGRTGPFCVPEFIVPNMNKQFAILHAENYLAGLDAQAFAGRAAFHAGELNVIHPFLDGNGRTLRAFLECLGDHAGYRIELALIEPDRWNHASAISYHSGDNALLAASIAGAIVGHARELEAEQPEPELDDDFEL